VPKGGSPAAPERRWRAAVILAGFAVAVAAAAFGGWWYARESPPHQGPLVLISIDTLRADHLPAYGYTRIKTPTIDALATDGVVFERAYSHSPQTFPAHSSMFTGRLPFEHGVRDNVGYLLKDDERTLAELLRNRGFSTGAAVSSYVLRRESGIAQGFAFYDAELPAAAPESSIAAVQRDGAVTVEAAERWIASQDGRRFFLFLHLYEPHKPYSPPTRFAQYAPYDGEIAYADELVGRIVHALKERDLYDAATIVLLSDHGEGLGDHGEQEHGLFLYDESVRVPFIVKQPGSQGAGRRINTVAQHIDIVPTLLDLVRAPIPTSLRGRSLRPLLDSRDGTIREQGVYGEAFYSRLHFGWSELYSLTDSRYRYIRAPREELYDLEQDPHEQRNLAADRQQSAEAMRSAIEKLVAGRPLEAPGTVSAADEERFAALGYIGATRASTNVDTTELADPKDMRAVLEAYRAAVDLASQGRFGEAVVGLRAIVQKQPAMVDVWQQMGALLLRTGRAEEALSAYRKVVALTPDDPNALVAVSGTLMRLRRLEEARAHADLATRVAEAADARSRAAAHEAVVRVALAQKDANAAIRHAAEAQKADPSLPLPHFVQGRLLYDQGRYDEALAAFQQAEAALKDRTLQISELQFYLGDTLARLDRYAEAEHHFQEELRIFPRNIRVYASLAMLYRASNRVRAAEQAIAELMRVAPTPEGYALAARLWTIFGERGRADAIRADARQRFRGDPSLALLDRER
jgi:arylsulfatase A-like enzyme/Tfp pilus assembly protein PilF